MNSLSPTKSLIAVKLSTTAAFGITLAMCLSPVVLPVLAAQDQSSVSQAAEGQDGQQAPSSAAADPQQDAPPPGAQSAVPPPAQNSAVPETLILPAGTVIPVRTTEGLSSDRNHAGDTFSATLEQPLVANGWVVARRGQSVIGRVAQAQKAGHGQSDSHLGLELGELVLIDGRQVPVSTQLSQKVAAGPSQGQKVGTVAATTVIGATIGAIAGRGTGAAIGAGVGATAGIGGVMATRGRPTVVPPETVLTFTLQAPLQVSTAQSQVAFQPVSQRDYGRDEDAYARPPAPSRRGPGPRYLVDPGYGYPAYYYGYCSPYILGCYPYPAPLYFGFYGAYGFGHRGRFFRR
jgi:hypothetical protein